MKYGKEPAMMFVKGYSKNGFAKEIYHVHVCFEGLQDGILFRDYLLSHQSVAKEYERVKISAKQKHEFDRDEYTDAKYRFVMRITELAKSEMSETGK